MKDRARVAIVGAGIVGCAVAEHLSELGERDVVVLERGPLFETGGSTSHAPGLVFQTGASKTMTELASYTVGHFSELGVDGEPCFHSIGGIEAASTPERWEDLKRKRGLANSWGLEAHLLSPDEVGEREPLLDPNEIYGGLYVPSDGVAKAVRAGEAMARNAQSRGVCFYDHTPVTGLDIRDGRVRGVHTPQGAIEAEVVVSCAGMWGPVLGEMAGLRIPLLPMQHQLAWTGAVPELAGEEREVVHPMLRHQDHSMYFRQRRDHYGIGTYRHRVMPVSAREIPDNGEAEVMPSIMPFTPEDFEPSLREARRMLPALENVGVEEGINGLFSFTPDGSPLLGESNVKGLWIAEAVWITHSAGVGRVMAEWITGGATSIDVSGCDIDRFEGFALSPSYVGARSSQSFREVYDITHPQQPMAEPRPLRTSPFYIRQKELDAYFLEASGWERPQWYEANAPLVEHYRDSIPDRDEWAGRYWSPVVGAEHLATRERVALYDMTSLKQAEVSGPGALELLQRLTTGEMDKPVGKVTYTLMLDPEAGVKSDVTVTRLGEERFQVGCNGPRDVAWMHDHAGGQVQIRDLTPGSCCVGIWGPCAREVVQPLSPHDLSDEAFPFFNAREILVGEVPVTALRVSYVGELGWELYTTADFGLRLWDLLWRAGQPYGVVAAGRGAFNSLRLEKGYRGYGADVTTEHDPYEAGLGFAVRLEKGDFIGREALLRRREEGPRRRLCCLVLDDPEKLVMGSEPVFAGGEAVGYVTSAAHGYSLGESLAYAWLPTSLASEGTYVEVEYFGERYGAVVAKEPRFDPQMLRMRPVREYARSA